MAKLGLGEKIAGGAALAKGVGKGVFGASQLRKAKRIKPVRPTYKTPKEKLETAAMYRNVLKGEDPVTKRAEASIEKQAANQVSRASKYATSGGDVLGMLGSIQESAGEATQNLASQEAQRRASNMGAYATAMRDVASEKSKAWDYNKKQKFEEMSEAKSALTESGIQNIQSGFDEASAAAAKLAGGGEGGDKASPNASKPGATGKKKGLKKNKLNKDTTPMQPGKTVSLPKPAGGGLFG